MNGHMGLIINADIMHSKRSRVGGILCIKEKHISLILFLFLIVFALFHRFLIQCGVPDVTKYLLDLLNVVLFSVALIKTKRISSVTIMHFLILVLLLIMGTISMLVGGGVWNVTILNYILDLRSVLRPFIFFYVCLILLNHNLIEKVKDMLIIYQIVNAVYIVYQYFTLEVDKPWMRGDNLNGFFGIERGGNIYVNCIAVITIIIAFERYKNKQYDFKQMAFITVGNAIIATLIELKMFYIELVVMMLIYFLKIKHFSYKKLFSGLILIPVVIVLGRVMIMLLYKLYPSMDGSLSLEGMMNLTSKGGYTGGNDLNRISFIQGINNYIFHSDLFQNLFGLGLGSATINSDFFLKYDSTHYTWFSSAYIYVEMGIIGLLLYLLSFISMLLFSLPYKKKYMQCIVTMTLIMIFYNETMKTEACYFVAFALACGFVRRPVFQIPELQD